LQFAAHVAADGEFLQVDAIVRRNHGNVGSIGPGECRVSGDYPRSVGIGHLQMNIAVHARQNGTVFVFDADFRTQSAGGRIDRTGGAYNGAMKEPSRELGHLQIGVHANLDPRCAHLGHRDEHPQHARVRNSIKPSAGVSGGGAAHQIADAAVAGGDHTGKGRDHFLILRLIDQPFDVRVDRFLALFSRLDGGLRGGCRRCADVVGGLLVIQLLLRQDTLRNQLLGALQNNLRELQVGLGLHQSSHGGAARSLELVVAVAVLAQLLVQIGRIDIDQGLAFLHAVADIDIDLGDVAFGAGIDGGFEYGRDRAGEDKISGCRGFHRADNADHGFTFHFHFCGCV